MDIEQLFDDLVRVEIALWGAAEDRVRADHDVPLAFLEFLRVIDRRRGCRVGDIAADLDITVGGTSKIVDRLEARGYVERVPNPDDRRSSLLRETPAGARLRTAAGDSLRSVLEARLGSVLPRADLRALASALATLRAARPATDPEGSPE